MKTKLFILSVLSVSTAFADTKISDLPSASALAGTESIPVVQSGVTRKTTPSAFGTYLNSHAPVTVTDTSTIDLTLSDQALNAVVVEAGLESILDLADLQGAVTDAQVPDSITVTLAATATALAANGANCSAGSYPLGVDASGAVENCTDATTEIDSAIATHAAAADPHTGYRLESADIALGTSTSGNYVSSATTSQGLTLTGTEGASLGLQDCAANEIMKRNAGDTAWACAADSAGGGVTTATPAISGNALTANWNSNPLASFAVSLNANLGASSISASNVPTGYASGRFEFDQTGSFTIAATAFASLGTTVTWDGPFVVTDPTIIVAETVDGGTTWRLRQENYPAASFDVADFGSGAATDNYVLTADGAGGSAWEATSGVGVTDGDKGDITVSSSGTVWSVDSSAVAFSELSGSATDAQVPNNITIDSATLAGTVTVVDSTDSTSFVGIFDSATGSLAPKTDAGLTYNASTGMLTATGFTGPLTGNASGSAASITGTLAAIGASTSANLSSTLSDENTSGGYFTNPMTTATDMIVAGASGVPTRLATGSGVTTALGVNIGSAGAPVLFNGAGGTPTSLVLTNATLANSTSLPGTCTVGQLYQDTDADTDGDVYFCRATNTWKSIDDDGGAGGLATADIDTSAELYAILTDETGSASGTPLLVFNQNPTINGAVLTGVIDAGGATSTEIVNGANPTTDAAGEIAVDTSTGAGQGIRAYGAAAFTLPAWQNKCVTINAAAAASDFMVFSLPYAATVQQVTLNQIGATNVVGQWDECDSAGANCSAIDSTDLTATTTKASDTAPTNAGIDAGDVIAWRTTSVSGTNTQAMACIDYTVDQVN